MKAQLYIQLISLLMGSVLLFPLSGKAQTGIKRHNLSSPSVLLEFNSDPAGIVLPWVTAASAVANTPGTFIFDQVDKCVKLYTGSVWKDYSGSESNGALNPAIQNGLTEKPGVKTVLGATSSTVDGVWVLESTDKAMVLPKVENPETSIVNPTAGMIVYDPVRALFCTFNGRVWSFWTYE